MLLMLLASQPLMARADELSINVDMQGNANITITNDNGTITIIYNGLDILYLMSSKTEYYYLKSQLLGLMSDLDLIFKDVYGKLNFIAYVTGVNSNDNSTIALTLKAGNATLVDFVNQLFGITETQSAEIANMTIQIQSYEDETSNRMDYLWQQILSDREYFESQIQSLNAGLVSLNNNMNTAFNSTQNRIDLATQQIESLHTLLNLVVLVFGVLNITMLVLLIWISRWKASKTSAT